MVEFDPVDPDSPEAQEALAAYFGELQRRFGFDPVTGGAHADRQSMKHPNGIFFVLKDGDHVIGCGGVQSLDGQTAEIKRMWIHDGWRGRGLGKALLSRLEEEAVGLGRTRVVLDTNGSLTEARAMYVAAGYREIDRYNANPFAQHFFEKTLVD